MDNSRTIDARESVRVVTKNDFITADGIQGLSLKARKLLYLAISQCKMRDNQFYQYSISIGDFACVMGIDSSNLYEESDMITDELIRLAISVRNPDVKKGYQKYSVFSMCRYVEHQGIEFHLNREMTDLLLNVKKDFTKPLLNEFLRMKSTYSIAIWHLMQRNMESNKPFLNNTIEFYLSLDELRHVTGCQNKLKQVSQFRERALDKAIREIKDNCAVIITYEAVKQGRTIIGFNFKAKSIIADVADRISKEKLDKAEYFDLRRKMEKADLSRDEYIRMLDLKELYDL